MKKVQLGGDRLGSGNKMEVDGKTFNRSTHDLGYLFRTTASVGTLVPFMCEVALPGDTMDITLNVDVKTLPTIGPLFGSQKVQLDIFRVPVRLYQGKLHMNLNKIGLNMRQVRLPQMIVQGRTSHLRDKTKIGDNAQVNPSSLLAYLNVRGVGLPVNPDTDLVAREFNAIPLLAYWEIYKNYYANKQEEIGACIHNVAETGVPVAQVNLTITQPYTVNGVLKEGKEYNKNTSLPIFAGAETTVKVITHAVGNAKIYLLTDKGYLTPYEIFENYSGTGTETEFYTPKMDVRVSGWVYQSTIDKEEPKVQTFSLENIDTMRENILMAVKQTSPFYIDNTSVEPYRYAIGKDAITGDLYQESPQQGLALKTYQSDLFNNWMATEWLDGETGINQITAVDVSDGKLQIDTFILANKVFNLLNRIAISGGTYDDWLDATYDHDRVRQEESPVYEGGLIKELVFQEVISNAEAGAENDEQPLGTLAGKGVLSNKHKGGKITIKTDEISYIIGIFSITPRVDYSQGNKWDMNLKTMDDFHKPDLNAIGFQDLTTDQMAWFDTKVTPEGQPLFKSAGKQVAWINYMTNVNVNRGHFADEDKEMYMTFNRKYEWDFDNRQIGDLTTYIDPVKYNNIFAKTSRDAMNYWVQIAVDNIARRKVSAKVMPNL